MLHFLSDGRLRDDRDAVIDFDGALHGLDVVELHDGLDLEFVLAEDLIDGLARRDVGVEADKFLRAQFFHVDLGALRQRMSGRGDEHEMIVAEGQHLDLALFHGESHETEIHGVVQNVFVDEVRAAVFHAYVDGGEIVQEFFDERRQLVQADRVNRGNADRPADDFFHLLQLAHELVVGVQHLLGRLVDAVTFARELKLLLAPVDQQRLKMALHRPRLLTHRRLGDAIEFSGLGKALRLHQVRKNFKILNLHN